MIQLTHLTKSFRGRRAVDDVSFAVSAGEIVGLLGPNGAGKSTLLALLLGHVRPDAGETRLGGVSVQRHPVRARRGVGVVLGGDDLHPHLTGWENLAYLACWSGEIDRQEHEAAAELVGLMPRMNDRASTYSRGMRLRLALAAALVPAPTVLILDEPMEGLDPSGIADVRALLHRLRAERGVTVLLASHLLSEVERTCDRAIILDAGRVVCDTPCRDDVGGTSLEDRYLRAIRGHVLR